jgi:hypothetical protein
MCVCVYYCSTYYSNYKAVRVGVLRDLCMPGSSGMNRHNPDRFAVMPSFGRISKKTYIAPLSARGAEPEQRLARCRIGETGKQRHPCSQTVAALCGLSGSGPGGPALASTSSRAPPLKVANCARER